MCHWRCCYCCCCRWDSIIWIKPNATYSFFTCVNSRSRYWLEQLCIRNSLSSAACSPSIFSLFHLLSLFYLLPVSVFHSHKLPEYAVQCVCLLLCVRIYCCCGCFFSSLCSFQLSLQTMHTVYCCRFGACSSYLSIRPKNENHTNCWVMQWCASAAPKLLLKMN